MKSAAIPSPGEIFLRSSIFCSDFLKSSSSSWSGEVSRLLPISSISLKKKITNLARTTLFRICRGFPMLEKGTVRVQSNHSTTGTKSIIMIILIIITINNTWRCWSTQPFDRQATATGSWIYPPRQPLPQNWKKRFFLNLKSIRWSWE